jgi:hypothetical protein
MGLKHFFRAASLNDARGMFLLGLCCEYGSVKGKHEEFFQRSVRLGEVWYQGESNFLKVMYLLLFIQ